MSTFDLLADLPLEVDGYSLDGLRLQVSSGFERLTTVVRLRGGGLEGVGEDVVYQAEDHVALQEAGPVRVGVFVTEVRENFEHLRHERPLALQAALRVEEA